MDLFGIVKVTDGWGGAGEGEDLRVTSRPLSTRTLEGCGQPFTFGRSAFSMCMTEPNLIQKENDTSLGLFIENVLTQGLN